MKGRWEIELFDTINRLLGEMGEDDGHPYWCYEKLATDMTAAAVLVYNASMQGQEFMKQQSKD